MLTAKFLNSYPSKAGVTKARYAVSGSATELAAYEQAQGTYLRHEGTSPVLFADVCPDQGRTYKVNMLPSGRYILDLNCILTASGSSEAVDKRSNSASFKNAYATIVASSLAGTTINSAASSALQAAVAEKANAPEPADLTEPIITSEKKLK